MPPLAISTALGGLLAVLYVALFLALGLASIKRGHWIMFMIGIFMPIFWLFGALMPRRRGATGVG